MSQLHHNLFFWRDKQWSCYFRSGKSPRRLVGFMAPFQWDVVNDGIGHACQTGSVVTRNS